MTEIEVKIKIDDPKTIKEKILSLGASLKKERFWEENTLYDFPSSSLYKKHQALRLRKINKKFFLAFKGPPQKSRKFKIKEEYETEIRNGKQFKKILKKLNLKPVFYYQKYRTVYQKKRLKICIDETPIGNFLELEGEQNKIVQFAHALGFSKKEFIKLDYIQLLQKEEKKRGRSF